MSGPLLVLVDDAEAARWEPYALTRPAGELVFGTMTLRARAERALGLPCAGHLAAPHLRGFEEPGAAPVVSADAIPADRPRLVLLSRAVVGWDAASHLPSSVDAVRAVTVGGVAAGWLLPAGAPLPDLASSDLSPSAVETTGDAGEAVALPGRVVENVWELMSGTPDQIADDVAHLFPAPPEVRLPAGAYRIGAHALVAGEGVTIEPGVVFDLSAGPVWLDEGATVRAFTRIAGPAYVGRKSTVLGGSLESCSIGPVCRIRGEFAESVCLGWVNKAHDGHIGHAYLGAWVNLGAETTNSDLKNNYGSVRLWTPGGEVDTGEMKIGCFLGDHVKTGIGLLLNTGTVVGAGSNLYGAAMPPRFVPPFSWGTGDDLTAYRVDKFLEVAERAMARRRVGLTDGARAQLRAAWERARIGPH